MTALYCKILTENWVRGREYEPKDIIPMAKPSMSSQNYILFLGKKIYDTVDDF